MVKGRLQWLIAALRRADALPGVRRLALVAIVGVLVLLLDAGLLPDDVQLAVLRLCELSYRPPAPL